MMKPFNLELAKAGDPLMYCGSPAFFIGVKRDGILILIENEAGYVYEENPTCIFMAPKKRTVWVWIDSNGAAHVAKDLFIDTLRDDYPDTKFTKVEVEE